MPAAIAFLSGQNFTIANLAGSGLAFTGSAGWGASVAVGQFNSRTWISNSAGTIQGPEVDNVSWLSAGSGILGASSSGIALNSIPNYQSTLQIEFTFDTAVKAQNVFLRGYDRTNINAAPSGVTLRVYETLHTSTVQGPTGSGGSSWTTIAGSSSILTLANSPGASGLFAGNGTSSTRADTNHQWNVCVTISPDSIGSKAQVGLYCSLEYL